MNNAGAVLTDPARTVRAPLETVKEPRRPAEVRPGAIDVLTVGSEATVFRPVQRTLRGSGWTLHHESDPGQAFAHLSRRAAAVVIVEAAKDWPGVLRVLRSVPSSPEIILVTAEDVPAEEAARLGVHDLLRPPLVSADLLWSIATAWHAWMRNREAGSPARAGK